MKITENSAARPTKVAEGNRWRIKVIEAGRGSSGIFTADLLERVAPKFAVGTHVYLNHPSETETWDRPERSVADLIGKFVSEAEWDEETQALYADIQVYSDYAQLILERAQDIGMSIHAYGESIEREDGSIEITDITEVFSVDAVTKAGAGGALIALLESARGERGDATTNPIKENSMNEEQEALLKQMAATLDRLAAPATPASAPAPTPVEESDKIDPLAVAEALSASDLSERGRKAVVEAVRGGADLTEAISAQESYETELTEAAKETRVVKESTVEQTTGKKIGWSR